MIIGNRLGGSLAWVAMLMVTPAAAQTFTSGVVAVAVDVLVTRGGQPVTGLTADDFIVLDNGVPQQIESVLLDEVPITLLLVLDTSQLSVVTMLTVTVGTRETIVTVTGHLVVVMQCLVVTSQALGVVDRTDRIGVDPVDEPLERCPGGVTGPTVVFDHAVSGRNTTGCKDPVLTAAPLGTDPHGRHDHREHRGPGQPTAQPAAARKVDLDTLGQFTAGRQPVHTAPLTPTTTPTEPPAG